jgi:hypothetical protein
MMLLKMVAIRGLSASAHISYLSGFPPVGMFIDSDLCDTLGYE